MSAPSGDRSPEGGTAGNLLPGVPWIETKDVAELVLYLASDRARYATGGQYVLDAGLMTQ